MFTNDIGKSNYINYALYRDPIEDASFKSTQTKILIVSKRDFKNTKYKFYKL